MANLMGALIGAAIDRRDGDTGVKGAIIGSLAQGTLKVLAPILATYALGWAIQFGARKAWQVAFGADPVNRETGKLRPRAA